jgi:NAD(P)-dependent dehydrogenase (short-subunit alcohol dehydrogenase family)
MGRLDGKVAVVTGGASGIGEATVRLFHREGAKVVISDVQDDLGEALVKSIGAGVAYRHTDVTREDQVAAAVEAAVQEFGGLDVIFNNAGFGGVLGPIQDTPENEYQISMNILVGGVVFGMKHAVPYMKKRGGGSIINTASLAAFVGGYSPHIYAGAKANVVQLTRSVALELGEHFIRVNAICPGAILTPLLATNYGRGEKGYERAKEDLKTSQAIPRAGMPDDIARCALWLASDDSTFVTAQAICVDGGFGAGREWAKQAQGFKTYKPMRIPGQSRPKT